MPRQGVAVRQGVAARQGVEGVEGVEVVAVRHQGQAARAHRQGGHHASAMA